MLEMPPRRLPGQARIPDWKVDRSIHTDSEKWLDEGVVFPDHLA